MYRKGPKRSFKLVAMEKGNWGQFSRGIERETLLQGSLK
jgi:hypothetical protein